MTRILRYFVLSAALLFAVDAAFSQAASNIRGMHKVKRKETIYGIAKIYEISTEELIEANPDLKSPDSKLKKGDVLIIPWPSSTKVSTAQAQEPAAQASATVQRGDDVRQRAIRVGVMLPLHDINGDGRRMVEYYRGILMACDSLKQMGISVDVHAWNTAEGSDLTPVLADPAAAKCDIIFGPLYSAQMAALSDFVTAHDIRLVIPFSISAPQLFNNRNIFQVWQSPTSTNDATIVHYLERFKSHHPVFIDCNDSTSRKGVFTFALRSQLEVRHIDYSITNLKSGEEAFAKAFSTTKPNVVILNTARSPELRVAFAKINGLKHNQPELSITMFGYTEWLMYTRTHLDNFYKFDTYIPSVFYYNPLSSATQALPRFALTGFDHAYFFLMGLHKYGLTFNGAVGMFGYPPVQTPLAFERMGNGGLQNRSMVFVHYTPEHRVETISF